MLFFTSPKEISQETQKKLLNLSEVIGQRTIKMVVPKDLVCLKFLGGIKYDFKWAKM